MQINFLNKLPNNLVPEQAIILDALRTSILTITDSFFQLFTLLNQFSFTDEKPPNFKIFSSALSIIDNSYRLKNFYDIFSKHIDLKADIHSLEILKKTINIRHTFQHLDDRINEALIKKELPVFGQISWVARKEKNADHGQLFCIVSGYYPYIKQTYYPVNFAGKKLFNNIDRITLRSITRINKSEFIENDICFDDLMGAVSDITNKIEGILSERFTKLGSYDTQSFDSYSILDFIIPDPDHVTILSDKHFSRKTK